MQGFATTPAELGTFQQGQFGRVDVLLHAAGICPRKPLLEMSHDECARC